MPGTDYFGEIKPYLNNTSHTCQHHAEITPSHTFAALTRLSTTTHNLLTFNIGEISSNNSERRNVLANKHLWTFLSHSSYASSRMYSHALSGKHIKPVFTRKKKTWVKRLAWVKRHLQVCSHLIHLTPKNLFPGPKT